MTFEWLGPQEHLGVGKPVPILDLVYKQHSSQAKVVNDEGSKI